MPGFDMSDYVPVNERIEQFYKAHSEGSLQSEIVELTASRVTVKAYAYRKPDDERPGIGHSSLEIPGSTPYTRGSEIENCETSAWGRAIAALGFEVKRGVASREEVRNKQPEQRGGAKPSSPRAAPVQTQYRRGELADLMGEHGLTVTAVEAIATRVGISRNERPMSNESMDRLIEAIEQPLSEPNAPADGEVGARPASPTTPELDTPATAQGSEEAVPPGASDPASAQTLLDEAVRVAEAPTKKGRTTEEAIADAKAKAVA